MSSAVHRAVVAARVPRFLGRWHNSAIVFSYHNVVADNGTCGERVLHVPQPEFRDQIERIARRFRPVALGELLERHRAGRSLRGLVAVTFDDGYRGVLRHALPVLAEFGVPATIFVIAGALDRHEPFWWDRLADMAGGAVPRREHLLEALGGDEQRILDAHPSLPRDWSDDYLPATAQELVGIDRSWVALAPHTLTHPNLTRVSAERLEREVSGSWQALRETFDDVLPAFAYPYGLADDVVASAVAKHGLAGVGGATGPFAPSSAPERVPRLFVAPGVSADRLEVLAARLRLR
jgi:peptidoglycan/xylan/chitin deacetylase (PgdA/CDA1 family)